ALARCGALIVVTRKDLLSELVTPGLALDGQVSAQILETVFRKDSPVHDGAAIVEGDRITRVGCVLPLTLWPHVPRQWGTCHRAGMGLADRSDAIVVVVSEERGEVTLMCEGQVDRSSPAFMVSKRSRSGRRRQPSARSNHYDKHGHGLV